MDVLDLRLLRKEERKAPDVRPDIDKRIAGSALRPAIQFIHRRDFVGSIQVEKAVHEAVEIQQQPISKLIGPQRDAAYVPHRKRAQPASGPAERVSLAKKAK